MDRINHEDCMGVWVVLWQQLKIIQLNSLVLSSFSADSKLAIVYQSEYVFSESVVAMSN